MTLPYYFPGEADKKRLTIVTEIVEWGVNPKLWNKLDKLDDELIKKDMYDEIITFPESFPCAYTYNETARNFIRLRENYP